jgi:hypothetical protein
MQFETINNFWWVIALYVSFGTALSTNLNNKFQLDGLRLKVILASVSGISLLPTFLFIPVPQEPFFYLSMICAAVLLSINETKVLDMSAEYGGPFATLARPLIIILTFVIWAVIAYEDTRILLSANYVLPGVLVSFVLVAVGNILIVRHSVFATTGLKSLLHIAVLGALIAILIKLGMVYRDTLYQVFLWTCMLNILIGVSAFIRWWFKSNKQPITKDYIKYGSLMGILNTLIAPATTAAVALAPNPAFASGVFMLSTIWLSIYYKIIGQNAHMSFTSAIMIVLGVCLLTFVTNL